MKWKILFFIFFLYPCILFSQDKLEKQKTVDSIVAGTNVTVSPSNGKGDVTVNVSVPAKVTNIFDEGNLQGDATTLNFTGTHVSVSCSGSTCTVNISTPSDTNYYPYDLVVGTPGTPGVNAVVGSSMSFDSILATVSLRGTVFTSTSSAAIFFKNGIYPISNSTIPAGLTCYFDSSAVFKFNGSVSQQMVTVYGKMVRPNFAGSGIDFKSTLVQMSSNSELVDPVFYEMTNQGESVIGSAILGIGNLGIYADNVRVFGAKFKDPQAKSGINTYGDSAPIRVYNASNTYLDVAEYTATIGETNDETNIAVYRSSKTYITGKMYNLGAHAIMIEEGSVNTWINEMEIHYQRTLGVNACISIGENTGNVMGIPEGTLISNLRIFLESGSTGGASIAIGVTGGTATKTKSLILNKVFGYSNISGDSVNLVSLDSGASKTILVNVSSQGMGGVLTDSGSGTVKSGVYKNGVAVP